MKHFKSFLGGEKGSMTQKKKDDQQFPEPPRGAHFDGEHFLWAGATQPMSGGVGHAPDLGE